MIALKMKEKILGDVPSGIEECVGWKKQLAGNICFCWTLSLFCQLEL